MQDFIRKSSKQDIKEDYIIGNIIGEGAYGNVRLCVHKQTGTARAVKVIFKKYLEDIEGTERDIVDEIYVLRTVDHPGIMRIFEYFSDAKHFFVVSELYRGGELYQCIREKSQIEEKTAKAIMKELLIVVRYLHSKNIVHRDIKPENIMFEEKQFKSESLKLVDFGFATYLKDDEYLPVNIKYGTPYYIAPEILNKKNYNFKCDIWSCGVVMYCMLAGRPPYNGMTDAEIMCKIKLGSDKIRHKYFPHVSDKALNFLKKLLKYEQEQRLTAEEALNDPWFKGGGSNPPDDESNDMSRCKTEGIPMDKSIISSRRSSVDSRNNSSQQGVPLDYIDPNMY